MKIIKCDRCGTEGDQFPRELTVDSMYGKTPLENPDHMVLHLCGYCTTMFKKFLAGETT